MDPFRQAALDAAIAAFNRNDWVSVLRSVPDLDDASPHAWQALYVKGVALLERQRPAAALQCLRRAHALQPGNAPLSLQLARACTSMALQEEASRLARLAVSLEPGTALVLDSAGVILSACGLHTDAHELFNRAVALCPDNAGYRYNLATTLTFIGDTEEAARQLEACIRLSPSHWRAHHSLSYLKTQTSTHNHIQQLRELLPRLDGRHTASVHVRMALAKELEDIGEHDSAFDEYAAAKRGPARLIGYSQRRDTELMSALAALFPEPVVPRDGDASNRPIFIVGMPRTGTTLIDRILSRHPDVTSIGETHAFATALKSIGNVTSLFDPAAITGMETDRIDWDALGHAYLEACAHLAGQAPRFIDKFPMNFLYTGMIAHAFQNASIVCLHRDPMDTCLSNLRQLFAPESPYYDYSYDILDIGNYYIQFRKLMSHWEKTFPGRILSIQYEQLVENQATETRRLLDFCRLDWNPDCLHFEKSTIPVATASAVQVREPIHRLSMHRWKDHAKRLAPLHERLVSAGLLDP